MHTETSAFRQLLRRLARLGSRLDVAAILILAVLVLAAVGTCFPQRPSTTSGDPDRQAHWEALVRDRYGPLTDLLTALGLFDWFHVGALLGPLGPFSPMLLLLAATLICTARRWKTVVRAAISPPGRGSIATASHAPYTARKATHLSLPIPPDVLARLHAWMKAAGFRVHVGVDSSTDTDITVPVIRGDRYRWASLGTLFTHLGVLLLLPAAILTATGWREMVTVQPGETVTVRHNHDVRLRSDELTVIRRPDGSIADYQTQISLYTDSDVISGPVRLNAPLHFAGLRFYLHHYTGSGQDTAITFLVTRDPGYSLAILAGFLLLVGMVSSLYLPHTSICAWFLPDGTLHLAGWSGRVGMPFEREFEAFVALVTDL